MGSQESGYFSLMKYFGFMLLTRSVDEHGMKGRAVRMMQMRHDFEKCLHFCPQRKVKVLQENMLKKTVKAHIYASA